MKTTSYLICVLLLLFSLVTKAQPYQIGHVQITYTDPARSGRSIQTEIYYPATTAGTSVPVAAGAFPIIAFGHGFVMTWDAYQNMWEDMVPQGYIVAFPRTEGSISPVHAEFGKDLAFLISKLQSESATNSSSLFYNHVNSKSAIMGHSMGGGSSFLAAENNTSITTMVTFAAANTTPSSISAAQHVSVPTLVFSGQNDCVAPAATHQVPMYDSLASSCKAFISIKGAAHCEFANSNFNCSFGQSTCSPSPTITRTQQQDATADFLKLWLEYYLKDMCASWDVFNDSLAVSPRINHNQACTISNPVITSASTLLTSTVGSTYQWYYNGSLIPGATAQTYTATISGNYYVEVTYFNTCPYPSNTINLSITGIENVESISNVAVFPNPAAQELNVVFRVGTNEKVKLKVLDLLGQTIDERVISAMANQKQSESFQIGTLQQGLYFIEISSGDFKYLEKIVKQ